MKTTAITASSPMHRIVHVVGARPNFMKVAPVMKALACRQGIRQILVHTGQHYDWEMSEVFFSQLGLPAPEVNLAVGQGTHATQTARIMLALEPVLREHKPSRVLVYGDVNSTLAAALTSAKLGIPVGHVEAGLRSFDATMPEEINRLLTDQVADLLFTPSSDGDENLRREGIAAKRIHRVGNVMIDTLICFLETARAGGILERLGLREKTKAEENSEPARRAGSSPATAGAKPFGLVTLHRPANVDDPEALRRIVSALSEASRDIPLVFPVHPRTRERLSALQLPSAPGLMLADPLGYVDFLGLEMRATFVVTDSGGIQEETTYLGIPCLTLRPNTERPVTVSLGTNKLLPSGPDGLLSEVRTILAGKGKKGAVPPLWDGKAGERIADVIALENSARQGSGPEAE